MSSARLDQILDKSIRDSREQKEQTKAAGLPQSAIEPHGAEIDLSSVRRPDLNFPCAKTDLAHIQLLSKILGDNGVQLGCERTFFALTSLATAVQKATGFKWRPAPEAFVRQVVSEAREAEHISERLTKLYLQATGRKAPSRMDCPLEPLDLHDSHHVGPVAFVKTKREAEREQASDPNTSAQSAPLNPPMTGPCDATVQTHGESIVGFLSNDMPGFLQSIGSCEGGYRALVELADGIARARGYVRYTPEQTEVADALATLGLDENEKVELTVQ